MVPGRSGYDVGTRLPRDDGTAAERTCIKCYERYTIRYWRDNKGPYCGHCLGRAEDNHK